jgi:sugar phosphate isomerase/epimerase
VSEFNRREFLAIATAAMSAGTTCFAAPPATDARKKRRFTMDLCCGRIGVRANQLEAIGLAHKYGFESVEPSASYLAGLAADELRQLCDEMAAKKIVWGAAGLPVDFRRDDERFHAGMKALPGLAAGLQRAGVNRIGTWLSPAHEQLDYAANLRQHATRLRETAKVLGDHGLRLGLEYVGPKTSWTARRYPFVHNMVQTKELIDAIGCSNVGFVLDSWHWYTAEESKDDLLTLKNEDVVACDLNDAPKGRTVDQQIDNQRELPMATGVIDLRAFLGALVEIKYDGPVRAEPFNRALREMPGEEAVAATAASMKKAFALVDLIGRS